uniref:L1 transposable element RRM domain-containing protein n=1 Tax=Callithrix jacchus TaxID=9483 RepID=A0A8I3X1N8_CALJA
IGVPEGDEENESKLENTLQDIIQENFPHLARQANTHLQEIQRTPQRYSARRATPRHIIVRFNRVEIKERILRAARKKERKKPMIAAVAEDILIRKENGIVTHIIKSSPVSRNGPFQVLLWSATISSAGSVICKL